VPGSYDVVIHERESVSPAAEIAHSWAPASPKPGPKKTSAEASRELVKSLASWVLVVALAIDGLASVFEPLELLRHGAPWQAAIAATFASFGLASVFSIVAAVPIACVYSAVRLIGRLPRPWSFAWPVPLAGLGWLIIENFAQHPVGTAMSKAEAQWLLFGLLGGLLVVATMVARIRRPQLRATLGLMLGGLMLALSYALPPTIHREPRDVVWFCLIVSALAVLYPLRRRLRLASHTYVLRALGALVGGSLFLWALAPRISPSWRVYARDYGTFADRMGRFCRDIVDLDGDGFSALFGGLDCNDFDSGRNPSLVELPNGHDRNCNGLTRPATPTAMDLGLAPPVGEADAADGEIDRVVLVTFDCFRNDAFTPAVTPNLVRLAAKGVRLTKLYAGGSRTALSLPLMLRGGYDQRPVAAIAHDAGVSSTAIFAYRHGTLEGNVFDGFDVVQRPSGRDKRFRATEVTDFALADLRDPAHAHKHLLWAHYFDAHGPRAARVLPPDIPHHGPLPGEDADSALYLDELSYDDRELARLLDGLEETGGLDKTLIVVSADHGEGFGALNAYEHGQSVFEQIIHVPGVLIAPGLAPGQYGHVLSHRDVVATVLGAFGLVSKTPHAEDFGRSWLRLRTGAGAPLHTFVTTYSAAAHVFSWAEAPMISRTDDEAKLAVGYREGIERLYHLDSKDGETRDVDPYFPEEAARDRRELELYRDIDRPPP
jgi:arylsulfatase